MMKSEILLKTKYLNGLKKFTMKKFLKPDYIGVMPFELKDIHNGYFFKGHLTDSSESRETKADTDTCRLIIKDKRAFRRHK